MEPEEVAYRLVELYLREVSKSHEKRQMGLDTIMNAYFYALLRIQRKEKEIEALSKAVEDEKSQPPEEEGRAGEEAPEEEFELQGTSKEREGPMEGFKFD